MKNKIAALSLKLAQTDDDTSCSALNRLRAKLRELMKGGQKADNQVSMVVEKSIETMVELSKSCEDLKSENEKLLVEIEALRRKLGQASQMNEMGLQSSNLMEGQADSSDLNDKIEKYEALVADLMRQLAEKDETINDLEKRLYDEKIISGQFEQDLDKMTISQKALMKEVSAMKDELKKRDDKVIKKILNKANLIKVINEKFLFSGY